jgi:2-succinyl-5-enolpyruvyl-6-hydroxy-3-cyclohexene-1-carboxylate synthase
MTQAAWTRDFVDALVAAGVRDLAISPGSRSTPLAIAATVHPALTCHAIIDERSAAFFALGHGKRTGRPAALLCTSGTAGAHYYPAVIEASLSHAPLLVITADRPAELADCDAPQTVDQRDLYGRHVRRYFDLGIADASDDARRGMMRKAAQAVALTIGPVPGPVHVNAPARKPLEPTGPIPRPRDVSIAEVRRPIAHPDPETVAELAEALRRAERGVIVAGPASIAGAAARAPVARLVRATGFPLLAEAASQLRFGAGLGCDGFDALLRDAAFRDAHAPDLIVQLGAAPTSTGWREYAARYRDCPRWIVAPHGWNDPHNTAAIHVAADVAATAAAVADALDIERPPGAWRDAFAAWSPPDDGESRVARDAVAALPAGALLCVGNSKPIRTVDASCAGGATELAVWSQRGANGIDGLVSGAAGAAAAQDTPALLLLGDVSFAHDVGGLAAARDVAVPFAIVVVDNGGGRIFEQLPIAGLDRIDGIDFTKHWLTPPPGSVESIARAFDIPYARYQGRATIAAALERRGPSIIHAVVGGVHAVVRGQP